MQSWAVFVISLPQHLRANLKFARAMKNRQLKSHGKKSSKRDLCWFFYCVVGCLQQQQETIHEIKRREKNSSSYLKLSASEYEQANLRFFFLKPKSNAKNSNSMTCLIFMLNLLFCSRENCLPLKQREKIKKCSWAQCNVTHTTTLSQNETTLAVGCCFHCRWARSSRTIFKKCLFLLGRFQNCLSANSNLFSIFCIFN